MLLGKTVAVVVPAYNEERQIRQVLDTMPDFVDRIVVVNDCSRDGTADVVRAYMDERRESTASPAGHDSAFHATRYNRAEAVVRRIDEEELRYFTPSEVVNAHPDTDRVILVNHLRNGGVGAAIARGYKWCKDYGIDCTAVMAGDGQMDPSELESICMPVVAEGIDYVKGNRLIHRSAWLVIPKIRYFGNSILSMLTKIASGYWRVSDTQTGYTAISLAALKALRLYKIYPRYGMPNDMLVKLNIAYCTLREVEIKPVYNVGEASKMNIRKVIYTVSWLLCKSFFKRLWIKYLFKDFHPLFLLYNLSFCTLGVAGILSLRLLSDLFMGRNWSFYVLLLFVFLSISGFQFILSAMWMDMLDNDRLYKQPRRPARVVLAMRGPPEITRLFPCPLAGGLRPASDGNRERPRAPPDRAWRRVTKDRLHARKSARRKHKDFTSRQRRRALCLRRIAVGPVLRVKAASGHAKPGPPMPSLQSQPVKRAKRQLRKPISLCRIKPSFAGGPSPGRCRDVDHSYLRKCRFREILRRESSRSMRRVFSGNARLVKPCMKRSYFTVSCLFSAWRLYMKAAAFFGGAASISKHASIMNPND